MTWRRAGIALLALSFAVLGLAFQPHHGTPPRIAHAHRLDRPASDLPTLAP